MPPIMWIGMLIGGAIGFAIACYFGYKWAKTGDDTNWLLAILFTFAGLIVGMFWFLFIPVFVLCFAPIGIGYAIKETERDTSNYG